MSQLIKVSEDMLYPFWQKFCFHEQTSNDLRLCGYYPGQLNLFDGPDFRGAEYELDQKNYRGDVEIHKVTKDWYRHRHHLDRGYDHVTLHLVWESNPPDHVLNSKKRPVKTISMQTFPEDSIINIPSALCPEPELNFPEFEIVLKKLAFERFKLKVANIKKRVEDRDYDQVLYQLLMRILGSPNNADNFELLADQIRWTWLMQVKSKYFLTCDQWFGLLLLRSGLRNKARRQQELDQLKSSLGSILQSSSLSPVSWNFAGQRPHNHPVRHMQVLAAWIHQFPDNSIYRHLSRILGKRSSYAVIIKRLSEVFTIHDTDSVQSFICGEKSHAAIRWGRTKIIEIMGNVILPFFFWQAGMEESFGFKMYIKDIYFSLPASMFYSKLQCYQNWSALSRSDLNRFYVNQALLHLYHNYCSLSNCQTCQTLKLNKAFDKSFENI